MKSTRNLPRITKDKHTGLPLISFKRRPSQKGQLNAKRLAEILLEQETDWHHAAGQ